MPRVKPLGGTDYKKMLQGELQASRTRLLMDRKAIAKKTSCSYGTVRNYEMDPEKIPIGWLKSYIKATNMEPEVILNYLYDGKFSRKELKEWAI